MEKWLIPGWRQEKIKVSLKHLVPQNKDMPRDGGPVGRDVSCQIWDDLAIKTGNYRNTLNTKRSHESLLILQMVRDKMKNFSLQGIVTT